MEKIILKITDISIYNSLVKNSEDIKALYKSGLFSDSSLWESHKLKNDIEGLGDSINSRLRNRMSKFSLGIYTVLEKGPEKNIKASDELVLFTGFGEIETTNQIIKSIISDRHLLVSPTLFHNSVHHTPLGYYTIIKKMHNGCLTVSDGLSTDSSFVDYISERKTLPEALVIAAGEENSDLFKLDQKNPKNIVPSFISYRIVQSDNQSGFSFGKSFKNITELKESDIFKNAENVFAGKNIFLELKKTTDKNVLTEYPLLSDNPLGIIYRLSMPFILQEKGYYLILEEYDNQIIYFEVNI